MRLEASIYINKPAEKVYRSVKNIEEYPHFMLKVESVKILSKTSGSRLSELKININETPISWQLQETFTDKNKKIEFKCIKGDIANAEGFWEILKDGEAKTKLSIYIRLSLKGPLNLRYSNDFVSHKAQVIIRAMLQAFKRKLDRGFTLVEGDAITSELITYQNRDGKNIIGFFDHSKIWNKDSPFIVLPPGYGETKRDTLSTSYYLAKNGFNCIRYDATDHVGESDGDIVDTTLTKLKKDLLSTIDYIEKTYQSKHLGIVASSLGKRMALKAAAEDRRIKLLVGLVGVVNLQDTLNSVYKEDMIGTCINGRKWQVTDVLGFKVSGRFLETAIEDKFHNLITTIDDAKKIHIPIVFLVAENDAWVKLEDTKLVFETLPNKKRDLILLSNAMHQLHENPKAARVALQQIVISCAKHLLNKNLAAEKVIEPNLREFAVQNRIEKERLKLLDLFTTSKEIDFWSDYLTDFTFINRSKDYREYLGLLSGLLGNINEKDRILDAGCGVGYFGAWLINKIIEENSAGNKEILRPKFYQRCHYYAIDFVKSAIKASTSSHLSMKKRFLKKINAPDKLAAFFPTTYQECDLNFDLPFEDQYFDKICCSLVLSYLNDPLITARELIRTLKPKGKIVITSLKPFADLSQIYRNFVSLAKNEEDILEARKLLSSAGKIRHKESEGHYHFLSERELKIILLAAGAKNIRIFRSLGNQANVAVAEKTK
ncbi:MAG: methyltransferase domain-containing protein [Candidatus Omnitrophota bacterium]